MSRRMLLGPLQALVKPQVTWPGTSDALFRGRMELPIGPGSPDGAQPRGYSARAASILQSRGKRGLSSEQPQGRLSTQEHPDFLLTPEVCLLLYLPPYTP